LLSKQDFAEKIPQQSNNFTIFFWKKFHSFKMKSKRMFFAKE